MYYMHYIPWCSCLYPINIRSLPSPSDLKNQQYDSYISAITWNMFCFLLEYDFT